MTALNETHDPQRSSWVASANGHDDFPIQNLPFAVFRPRASGEFWRGGVAIGDQIVDLVQVAASGHLSGMAKQAAEAAGLPRLNGFMSMGPDAWSALRLVLSRALEEGAVDAGTWREFLVPQGVAEYHLPADVGDYTDFYTSIHHATSVGRLFRPDNPLLPNYKWVPIGYHGRSSTIVASGTPVRRPRGQVKPPDAEVPAFAATRRLDYELELGIFIGRGNAQAEPIPIADAE